MRLDKETIDTINALCNVIKAHKDYNEFLAGLGVKITYEPETIKDLDATHILRKIQEILETHNILPTKDQLDA